MSNRLSLLAAAIMLSAMVVSADAWAVSVNVVQRPTVSALGGKTLNIRDLSRPQRPIVRQVTIPTANIGATTRLTPPQSFDLPPGSFELEIPGTSAQEAGGLRTTVEVREGETLTINLAARTVTKALSSANQGQPGTPGTSVPAASPATATPTTAGQPGTAGQGAARYGLPLFQVGLGAGFTSFGGGDGDPPTRVLGLDNFGGILRFDARRIENFNDSAATLGFSAQVNPFTLPGMPRLPWGIQPTFRTGFNVNPGSHEEFEFSGVNAVPQVGGTAEISRSWSMPFLLGALVPIKRVPNLYGEIHAGFYLNRERVEITARDAGAPGTPAYSTEHSRTAIDPAFGFGAQYRLGEYGGFPFYLGGGLTLIKRGDISVSAPSPNFSSQTTSLEVDQGWDKQLGFSLSIGLGPLGAPRRQRQ